ncbi:MAG: hypothetical protein RL481_424 [Pseudomonadota bacterium]
MPACAMSARLMKAPGAFVAPVTDADRAPAQVMLLTPADLLADHALAAEWDALSACAAEPNPFAERWYLEAALSSLPVDDVHIALVRATGQYQGTLIGMIPLCIERSYAGLPLAHMRNWINHNAFLGNPLIRRGAEKAFWQALLAHLDSRLDGALFFHIVSMNADGVTARALESQCHSERRRHALVHHEERALLEHGLSPDAYWEATVRGKKRKELRRQHKRLAEEGQLDFARAEGEEGLDEWIDEFLALEIRGWKGSNRSALACDDATSSLFRKALHGAAATGKLERLTLRLNNRPIAMLANFLTPPGAFSFKTAFDEDYARFSPGVLLQIENLALLERDGIAWCDSCAAADHPMIDSLWSGRRAIGRYSVAIGGPAKRAAFAALLAAERAKSKLKGRSLP